MTRWWRVLSGLVVLLAALAPLPPAAAAGSGEVVLSDTHYATTSPNCSFPFTVTATVSGNEKTALHGRGSWSCPDLTGAAFPLMGLGDVTLNPAGYSIDWGVRSYGATGSETSGSVSVDYAHPKTAHAYRAGFQITGDVGSGASTAPSPSPYCGSTGRPDYRFNCNFDSEVAVDLAPPVGPAAAVAPAGTSVTLAATDGSTCQMDLSVAPSGVQQLSFVGTNLNASCDRSRVSLYDAQAFAYPDRHEAGPPLVSGNRQCGAGCVESSSGAVPALSGQMYTVTYYVNLSVGAERYAALPPECTFSELFGYGYVDCELTVSAVYP